MADPAETDKREQFIPIRVSDLIEVLCQNAGPTGDQKLSHDDRERFRKLARLMAAYFHSTYHKRLLELKEEYSSFDPDADTREVFPVTDDEREIRQNAMFDDFIALLEKANYRHFTREQFLASSDGSSFWGIDMTVDWSCFERIEVFARGSVIGRRSRRDSIRFWRKREYSVPNYQRLVIIIKQNNSKRLGPTPDTRNIFLKLFKDIPQMDIEMVLPGTRLKMPRLERGKLGVSILTAVVYSIMKIAAAAASLAGLFAGILTSAAILPLAIVAGYGYKTWSGFQVTKQSYMLQLTKSLYYQNLDNNGGVLFRLLDDAEEQESREAILAYYFLTRFSGDTGWSAKELDAYIELELETVLKMEIDFEVSDALIKLQTMGLATAETSLEGETKYRVIPVEAGIESMMAKLSQIGDRDSRSGEAPSQSQSQQA